ncbi:hypothetical protein RAS1_26720 [Phycisphaerae bacterium RAS1]|nr:hypothetical protein RAS1_26720 [Phycisphaerae bacterium RAS1]
MGKLALACSIIPLIGFYLCATYCCGHPLAAIGSVATVGGTIAVLVLGFNGLSGRGRVFGWAALAIGAIEAGAVAYFTYGPGQDAFVVYHDHKHGHGEAGGGRTDDQVHDHDHDHEQEQPASKPAGE